MSSICVTIRKMKNRHLVWLLIPLIFLLIFGYLYLKSGERISQNEMGIFLGKMEEKKRRELKLQECLDIAELNYRLNWKEACESQGLKEDCSLPRYRAGEIEDLRKERLDRCIVIWK